MIGSVSPLIKAEEKNPETQLQTTLAGDSSVILTLRYMASLECEARTAFRALRGWEADGHTADSEETGKAVTLGKK